MNRRILKLEIGKTTYTIAAKFKIDGKATAKTKLLRLMERDLQQISSLKIGQADESVVRYE